MVTPLKKYPRTFDLPKSPGASSDVAFDVSPLVSTSRVHSCTYQKPRIDPKAFSSRFNALGLFFFQHKASKEFISHLVGGLPSRSIRNFREKQFLGESRRLNQIIWTPSRFETGLETALEYGMRLAPESHSELAEHSFEFWELVKLLLNFEAKVLNTRDMFLYLDYCKVSNALDSCVADPSEENLIKLFENIEWFVEQGRKFDEKHAPVATYDSWLDYYLEDRVELTNLEQFQNEIDKLWLYKELRALF